MWRTRISLDGHTDAIPYGNGQRGYSNWELSADRANASRRELVSGGLPDEKLARVEGLASSRLLDASVPNDPINRRISIIVMTQEAEERMMPAPGRVSPWRAKPRPYFETRRKPKSLRNSIDLNAASNTHIRHPEPGKGTPWPLR